MWMGILICLISTVPAIAYPIKTVIVSDGDAVSVTATGNNLRSENCFWALGNPLSNNYKYVTSSPFLTLNGSALQVHDYGFYYYYDGHDSILMVVIVQPKKGNTFYCSYCWTSTTCRLSGNQLLFKFQLSMPEEFVIKKRCQLFGINSTTNRTYYTCTIGITQQCLRNISDRYYVECPLNSSFVNNAIVDIRSIPKHPSFVHCPTPPVISNLVATKDCYNHFRISWNHISDAVDGYNITLMQSNKILLTNVTNDNSHSYDKLTAESNYTVFVTGCNNNGCNFTSLSITTSSIVPGGVRNLRSTGSNTTSVTITWDTPVTDDPSCRNITYYLIVISKGLPVLSNTSTPLHKFTIHNLTSNTTYAIKVVAVNIAGPGKPVTFNITTDSHERSIKDGQKYIVEIVVATVVVLALVVVVPSFFVIKSKCKGKQYSSPVEESGSNN